LKTHENIGMENLKQLIKLFKIKFMNKSVASKTGTNQRM
jgi:hypothetical protein